MSETMRDETMSYAEFCVLRQAYVGRCQWLCRVPSAMKDHTSWRGAFQTQYPDRDWDKTFLPLLYESVDFNTQSLEFMALTSLEEMVRSDKFTVISSHTFGRVECVVNPPPLPRVNMVETHEKVFRCAVGDPDGSVKALLSDDTTYHHFKAVNLYNPYLAGGKYRNRFKRGTKVYCVGGPLVGEHAVVVGHAPGFDITDNKRPLLRLLFACSKVFMVSQNYVVLVDLHGVLPFGVPVEEGCPRPRRSPRMHEGSNPWVAIKTK